MSRQLIILLFLIFPFFSFSQGLTSIDSLSGAEQILNYVIKVDERVDEDFHLVSDDSVRSLINCADSVPYKIYAFNKVDINQDSISDLIVNLVYNHKVYSSVIMGAKTNQNKSFNFWLDAFEDCMLLSNIKFKNQNQLVFARLKHIHQYDSLNPFKYLDKFCFDTLVYKFGVFIEKQHDQSGPSKEIRKIYFSKGPCLGTCPVFNMEIKRNGKAIFKAQQFNKPFKGRYKTRLSKQLYQEIWGLLNYIQVNNLRNHYSVPWTDDAEAVLKVTFADGTTKAIQDYGLQGTIGLHFLYQKLTALRGTEKWKKIK